MFEVLAFACSYLNDLGQSLYFLFFAVNLLFEALAAWTLHLLLFFLEKVLHFNLHRSFFEIHALIEEIKLLVEFLIFGPQLVNRRSALFIHLDQYLDFLQDVFSVLKLLLF